MKENSTTTELHKIAAELEGAYYKLLGICVDNFLCDTCPLYDNSMENEFGTKCLDNLLYKYSIKLKRVANTLEEKGE